VTRDTPAARIAAACARRGEAAVVSGCIELLAGRMADDELVVALGGPPAHGVLDGQGQPYWLRVWGARGLLYAWDDAAIAAVLDATRDDAWRVREMAAKVTAKRRLDLAASAMSQLRHDDVARVRAAAERALIALATP
jgi:hypothetical protein